MNKEKVNFVNNENNFIFLKPNYPDNEKYEKIKFSEKKYKIPTDRPVRIYSDGIFDLFHIGHARLFSQLKNMFPNVYLIVGVCSDVNTLKNKGSVVMNEKERYESVLQCKFVDEVIEDAPWVLDIEFLNNHNIDYVAHDEAPYAGAGTDDVYGFVKKIDKFILTKRGAKISTTSIITRIIRDHNLYVRRQLLRGINHKDLNVSFFTKRRIEIENSLEKDVIYMKEEFRYALSYWEEFSKKWIYKIKNKFNDQRNFMKKIFKIANKDEIK